MLHRASPESLTNTNAESTSVLLNTQWESNTVDDIVLIRRGALGDVALLGSITSQIKGSVTVITAPQYQQLASLLIGVDNTIGWTKQTAHSAVIDLIPEGAKVIDLQGNRHTKALARAIDRNYRSINKRSIRRRARLWFPALAPRPTVPEIYAEPLQIVPSPPPWFDIKTQNREGLALVPGAAWATKQYHLDGFAEVGRSHSGPVYILGGPDDGDLVDQLSQAVPGSIPISERGFTRTLEALSQCAVAVSGDTGPMHLAGAAGCRVVGLFGPTHPSDGFFVYPGIVVQDNALKCRPCTLHRQPACPRKHHKCMQLSAATIIEMVGAELKSARIPSISDV